MNGENTDHKKILQTLLGSQKLGVLATTCGDVPHTSIVAFSCSANLEFVYFGTPIATIKFRNIEKNPRVQLLIDNRQNLAVDFSFAAAASVIGEAEILVAEKRNEAHSCLLKKHPELSQFFAAPTCALVKIKVEKFSLVTRFQEVSEFSPAQVL